MLEVLIDGRATLVQPNTSVAAAILSSGRTTFRTSISGKPRAALCGMGICYECRVTIDGMPHSRSCQILCRQGMDIVTG